MKTIVAIIETTWFWLIAGWYSLFYKDEPESPNPLEEYEIGPAEDVMEKVYNTEAYHNEEDSL